jgi:hypothetical protein
MSDLSGTAENRFYKHTMEGTIMDRVAVAKELVSIARELDERYEETGNQKYLRLSNAVTETLEEVVAEHKAMQRAAQTSPMQQVWQQQPGESAWQAWNPAALMGKVMNTPAALAQGAYEGIQGVGSMMSKGPLGPLQQQVAQIDNELKAMQQRMYQLQQQKAGLMQQGVDVRRDLVGDPNAAAGLQKNVNRYNQQMGQPPSAKA